MTRTDATLASIGAQATVGPFAYLRPAPSSRDGKIGTFVETKNSRSARAPRCRTSPTSATPRSARTSNLGAGAIFANYDDMNKHRTEIGVQGTGSHNVFVAPVRIGDGA